MSEHPESKRPIVVALDGSKGSRRAMEWAVANANGASLLGVHVLTYSHEFGQDLPPIGLTNWRVALQQELAGDWIEPAKAAGIPVTWDLIENDSTAAGLVDYADRHGASLIVIGARGRRGLGDRLLGSTAYKVIHLAHLPVLVVPEGAT